MSAVPVKVMKCIKWIVTWQTIQIVKTCKFPTQFHIYYITYTMSTQLPMHDLLTEILKYETAMNHITHTSTVLHVELSTIVRMLKRIKANVS